MVNTTLFIYILYNRCTLNYSWTLLLLSHDSLLSDYLLPLAICSVCSCVCCIKKIVYLYVDIIEFVYTICIVCPNPLSAVTWNSLMLNNYSSQSPSMLFQHFFFPTLLLITQNLYIFALLVNGDSPTINYQVLLYHSKWISPQVLFLNDWWNKTIFDEILARSLNLIVFSWTQALLIISRKSSAVITTSSSLIRYSFLL